MIPMPLVVSMTVLSLASAIGVRGAVAGVYHVDATVGDDANDGASPVSAWRTLDRVNTAELSPGDRVLFRRGGVWRGQLVPCSGASGAPVSYGAYGDGPKPRLLGSASMSRPEDWESVGPGLWRTVPVRYAAAGPETALAGPRWSIHTEAGAVTKRAPDSLSVSCESPGSARNHIQLSVGRLRIEAGRHYRLSFRARTLGPVGRFDVLLMAARSPWTARAGTASVLLPPDAEWSLREIVFRATDADEAARVTFFLGGAMPAGSSMELADVVIQEVRPDRDDELDVDVGNIIFDGGAAIGVKKWSAGDLAADLDYYYDAETNAVTLRMASNPAVLHREVELALRRHIIDQAGRSFVTYEDLCLLYGAAHGIGGGSTRGIVVRRCDIAYIGGGHHLTLPDGRPVRFGNGVEFWSDARDALVEDCRIWEIYDAALTNQGKGTNTQENIVYRRNTIWNSEYSFEYWNRDEASVTRGIVFEHNTCVDAGGGWGYGQRPNPNGRHLMLYQNTARTSDFAIRGNIFVRATDSLIRLHGRDWTGALVMDGNLWHQPEGDGLLWSTNAVSAADTPAFLRERGFDRNSVFTAPEFVDPVARDYRPVPGSPGAALGATAR